MDVPKIYHSYLQKHCQSQLQDIGKNSGATIRFPEPNSPLEAVAITAAPTRIKDVAKALLNLVPMVFTFIGDDPKLVTVVESSDFQYAITDHLMVVYRITLTTKVTSDNTAKPSPQSVAFQFQYFRPYFEKLREAINEVCRYVNSKGVTLEPVTPPVPIDPETKPFDQEKSNAYGQSSVTQPYHSPAQIAAAAQGTLHSLFHFGTQQGTNFHHSNFVPHGHPNGFQGSPQHFGRGFSQLPPGTFAGNRPIPNGNRFGSLHNAGPYQGGYPAYQPQLAAGRGGQGANTMNHFGHYNQPFVQSGGINANLNGTNGYQRRFMHSPSTPTGDAHQSPNSGTATYQQVPRGGGTVKPSSLDTLGSIELPDVSGNGNANGGTFRPHTEGQTPGSNGGPYSPSSQSYFPSQPNSLHNNGFPPSQGYPGGPPGSRYQG